MPTATPTTAPAPTAVPSGSGAEILYLSGGRLQALNPRSKALRTLADGVRAFAATPDGQRLALVRGLNSATELWLINRDGSGLTQLTRNDRAESEPNWAPDGQSLVYSAAATAPPFPPDYQSWSLWCATAEVRLYAMGNQSEVTLGAGCQPAYGPDGRRILFASPPTSVSPGFAFPGALNAIRMVNRQGQNGWSVARSDAGGDLEALVVYAPAWAPTGGQLAYQRFLGYQALVDITLTELSSSYERKPVPLAVGAGWFLPPLYRPDGRQLALVGYNFGDARGFSGYDIWSVAILDLERPSQTQLPSATLDLGATEFTALSGATAAAWSPDGGMLALVLPAGWRPGLSSMEPAFPDPGPAELWLWRPGTPPDTKLAEQLDFGSPLLWLP